MTPIETMVIRPLSLTGTPPRILPSRARFQAESAITGVTDKKRHNMRRKENMNFAKEEIQKYLSPSNSCNIIDHHSAPSSIAKKGKVVAYKDNAVEQVEQITSYGHSRNGLGK
mgnify:CR=1 FL=1